MPGRAMQVLLVTPNEADRDLASGFLEGRGAIVACPSLDEAAALIGPDIGCVVLVEDVLVEPDIRHFLDAVEAQPPWSDLPLLLIASQGTSLSALREDAFPHSGNVTLLQRPLHPLTLVSSVDMALRARQRQYEVRDLLEQRTRAVAQRDEFLAMLAHELRNPLAPIRNAVYLMKNINVPDPMFARYRGMIEKQTAHITRLVDDLLDVSRLELGKVELRPERIDLNQSVSAAAEACLPVITAQRQEVTLKLANEPLTVMADPVRIEQVLGNLILNAAKFTGAGGSIVIEAAREGRYGRVAVTDSGRGISPEMVGSVFELFVQEDSSLARTQGGLGIGLTLVKRLVELHGGEVGASSPGLGEGSRFEVRIPLLPSLGGEAAPLPSSFSAERRRRVLIVEDSVDIRESVGMMLMQWNHDVAYAADGPEGVALARSLLPDVAIIDIGLPGSDGYDVARQIRQGPLPWAREVKLLAMTGFGQANDRHRALESGFDDHLVKPVEPRVLERLLQQAS
jgi:two-component system, sensor histidine kinase